MLVLRREAGSMSVRKVAVVISVFFLATTVTRADGNKLLERCNRAKQFLNEVDAMKDVSRSDSFDVGYCMGFVTASWHSLSVIDVVATKYGAPRPAYCFPKGVNVGQMIRVVTKWLEEHPERLHGEDYAVVTMAMGDAFPCNQPRTK
jgi:hypothetical protein